MSETVALALDRVRVLIDDLDVAAGPAVSTLRLTALLELEAHRLADECGLGETRSADGFITLDARNPADYALPTTPDAQYMSVNGVVYDPTNFRISLLKKTEAFILDIREGGPRIGVPSSYALVPRPDQSFLLLLDAGAAGNEIGKTLKVLYQAMLPAFIDDDTTLIPFDDGMLRCLELRTAIQGAAAMNTEERGVRGLDVMVPLWGELSAGLAEAAAIRLTAPKLQARVRMTGM